MFTDTEKNGQEEISSGENTKLPMFACRIYKRVISVYVQPFVPWHWHREMELLLITSGTMFINCSGLEYEMHEGMSMFINAGSIHSFAASPAGECSSVSLLFYPEFIAGFPGSVFDLKYVRPYNSLQSAPYLVFTPVMQPGNRVYELMKEIENLFEQQETGYELRVLSRTAELWQKVILTARIFNPETVLDKQYDEERIKKMLEFIQENYGSRITAAEIAAAANISESECFRCFKRTLHIAPSEYLIDYRLRQAAFMLASCSDSISEIGYMCGFNSPAYFSKMFRASFHCTPNEYRKGRHSVIPSE